MKTFNFIKNAFIHFTFLMVVLIGCKKTEIIKEKDPISTVSNKTIKEVVFSGTPDYSNVITQLNADKSLQQSLISIKSDKASLNKYYLVEYSFSTKSHSETYVISKTPVTKFADLFNIPITKDGITAYDDKTTGKNDYAAKLMLKYNGKELDLNGTIAQTGAANKGYETNNVDPDEETEICIDSWWVTWNTETGQVISVEFLGSICYTIGGGGGGGGGGNGGTTVVNIAELWEGVHTCFGSNATLEVTTNYTCYVNNPTYVTKYPNFQSGYATHWSVNNTAQFQLKANPNNTVNVIYNNTSTTLNTSFPGPMAILYEGSYTPDAILNPNIDHNDTKFPSCVVIREGHFKVTCKIPGLGWMSMGDNVKGTLNASFKFSSENGGGGIQY